MVDQAIDKRSAIDKASQTQYPIEASLQQRWSPLAFSGQSVEPEKLRQVLEAARWSASSYNQQPWSYIVATKEQPEEFDRLLSCLAEGNQEWAKTAPVLMISVANRYFDYNGVENRHAFHDVGAASANLATEATALGLFIHQMAGFDASKVKAIYGIPEAHDPVAAIALGYLGDPKTLSESLQQRDSAERDRKPIRQFVFSGRWDQPASLTS